MLIYELLMNTFLMFPSFRNKTGLLFNCLVQEDIHTYIYAKFYT